MSEAYHLVNKVGLTYTDIKKLTKYERAYFLNSYLEEQQRLADEYK